MTTDRKGLRNCISDIMLLKTIKTLNEKGKLLKNEPKM